MYGSYLQVPGDDIINDHSNPSIGMWDTDGFCTDNVEYDGGVMAAPTDIDMEDDDHHIVTTTPADIEINENMSEITHKDITQSPIKVTKIQPGINTNQTYFRDQDCDDEKDGISAPIVSAK